MAIKESYAGKINRKLTKKLRVIAVAAGREKYSPTSCVTATSSWPRA